MSCWIIDMNAMNKKRTHLVSCSMLYIYDFSFVKAFIVVVSDESQNNAPVVSPWYLYFGLSEIEVLYYWKTERKELYNIKLTYFSPSPQT